MTAPLLFFMIFVAVEVSRVNAARNTMETAAYEGARRGIVPGATAEDVRQSALNTLNAVYIRDAQVQVQPTAITADTPQVTVTVQVALNRNFWVTPMFFRDQTLTSSLTLAREQFQTVSVP